MDGAKHLRALKYTGLVLLLICAIAFYAIFAPTHGRSLGVSITPRGFYTNTTSQMIPLYAISNHSSRPVLVMPAIERRPAPLLVFDMLGNTQRLLSAHSEILVTLSNNPPERAAVHCQRDRFFGDKGGVAKRILHTYLFFRKENEIVYP